MIKMEKKKINALIYILVVIFFTVDTIQKLGDMIILFILVLPLLGVLYNVKKNGGKLILRGKNIFIFITIFFIFTLVVDLLGGYYEETIKTTFLVFGSIYTTILMILSDPDPKETFLHFTKYLKRYVLFLVFYGLIIRFFGDTPVLYNISNNLVEYRQYCSILGIPFYQLVIGDSLIKYGICSLTGNPNTLSYLCVFAFAIVIAMEKMSIKKIVEIIFLLLGVCFSGSRLAIILCGLFIVIGIVLIQKIDSKEFKKRWDITLLCIGIIFILTILTLVLFDFKISNVTEQIDLNGREIMWGAAKNAIEDNFFLASGLGGSEFIIKEYTDSTLAMHNSYLELMVNYGIIFPILFIGCNLYLLIVTIKMIKELEREERRMFFCQWLILICLFVIAFAESVFMNFSIGNLLYFYVLCNLLLGGKMFEKKNYDIDTNL